MTPKILVLSVALLGLCNSTSFAQTKKPSLAPTIKAAPWKPIMEEDIKWCQRVWREIDVKSKENAMLSNSGALLNAYVKAVMAGEIDAYDASENSKLTKKLTKEEFSVLIARYGSGGRIDATAVSKILLKEDRLSIKVTNEYTIRIIGIAPVMDGASEPLFWLYYPKGRDIHARYTVHDKSMTWDDVFENRKFSSTIYKTADTSFNRSVAINK